jgi:hypothetical protein
MSAGIPADTQKSVELAGGKLAEPLPLGDRNLGVQQGGHVHLALAQSEQAPPRATDVFDADVLPGQGGFERAQGGEVASGHEAHADGHVPQVGEAPERGVGPRENGEARHAVEIRHELPHARVAHRAPLTGRVRDLQRLHERLVLGPLEVGAAGMARDAVHHIG